MVGFGDGLSKVSGRTRKSPIGSNTNLWTDRPKRRNCAKGMYEEHHKTAYAKYFKIVNSKIIPDL